VAWQQTLTAFSTVLATGTAVLIAGRAEWRTRRDRLDEAARKERAQAERVSAWLRSGPAPITARSSSGGEMTIGTTTHVWVVAQNNSDEPVWDAKVLVDVVELDADEDFEFDRRIVEFGLLPPGGAVEREVRFTPPGDQEPLKITFRDSGGRDWHRDEHGALWLLGDGEFAW
jgi:hypothetical protein